MKEEKKDKCEENCKICGGCNITSNDYKKNLELKTRKLKELLCRVIDRDTKIEDIIKMSNPLGYRNKGKYVFGKDKNGVTTMGFYEEFTHNIVQIENCKIQDNRINEVASFVYELVKKYNISIYNEDKRKGLLRHLIIRVGKNTNEIMIIFVTTNSKISCRETLIKELILKFPNIKTIVQNINEKDTNAILGDKNIKLYGNGYIVDILGGFKFKISPMSFYQVNSKQTEILYNKAIEYADLTGNETVYDLYSGIGTISIFLSKKVKKVYGIESVTDAVIDAKENTRLNKINNVYFNFGRVENILGKISNHGEQIDTIFVDPPRAGLDKKTIDTIFEILPRKIVYISCNPETLADNIKILSKKYKVKSIQPVDMFPFTSHVECVCVMKLR